MIQTLPKPDRWIVEVRDKLGNRVSRRYFDSEQDAHDALEERRRRNRVGNARVIRAADLRRL